MRFIFNFGDILLYIVDCPLIEIFILSELVSLIDDNGMDSSNDIFILGIFFVINIHALKIV